MRLDYKFLRASLAVFFCCYLSSCAESGAKHSSIGVQNDEIQTQAFKQREVREPEAATGWQDKKVAESELGMISAANPYAVKAGMDILRQGGTAIDAAIAIQTVLTLVEPQSSGIGGGGFILYWDNKGQTLHSIDARETAPKTATDKLFYEDGKPISWFKAVVGGRSVGTPGILAGLDHAHKTWGKLAWSNLFDEAIRLSEQGFVVSDRLAKLVAMKINPGINQLPPAKEYFFPSGQAIQAGQLKTNLPLANSFKQIANQGVGYFYQGELAKHIVSAVQNSKISPGSLSLSDLATYQAKSRKPVCLTGFGKNICGFGPPSSGGISVLQIIGMLDRTAFQSLAVDKPKAWHLFTQASRLAFADRNLYIADSDFVAVPVTGLLDPVYLTQRSQLINPSKDLGTAQAGKLPSLTAYIQSDSLERPSTSHISIVDKWGNAVSMTTSIEMAFGSGVMVAGFLLNNQLTDFSFKSADGNSLVANRIEPQKRPRSSMAPMMIFDEDNKLEGVIGSPGGSRIINYVSQSILAKLAWNMPIQEAINLDKVTNMNGKTSLESNSELANSASYFESLGHKVDVRGLNSGLHAIWRENGVWVGAADPRREGIAIGY